MTNKDNDNFDLRLEKATTKFSDEEYVRKDIKKTNADMPVQAGLWISDIFAEKGYSGNAVVRVKEDMITAYAPTAWNILTVSEKKNALLGIPFTKMECGDKDLDVDRNGVSIQVEFVKFVFNEKGVRFAEFKMIGVHKEDVEAWGVVVSALDNRYSLHQAHPFKNTLGVS